MKKTYKYIMTVAVILTGMLQLVSCDDANDWTVDPSVTKQRPPTSLSVEVDSATLDMTIQIGTIAKAASYELQISESPLSSNDDLPVGGEIYSFTNITEDQFVNGKFTIERVNELFTIEQDNTYYFRVRAIGQDGTVSNWYTNGMLYYGGVEDEKLAQKLIENTYYTLETPAMMWIGDSDIDPDALTVNWHQTKYVTAKYLRNETLGTQIDVAEATKNEEYTKTKVWYYTWEGLEANKEYTFSLLDEEGNTIASVTKATEYAPEESFAFFIGSFPKFTASSPDFTLSSTDANGNESNLFTATFHIAAKMKTEAKTNSDNPFVYPFDKSIFLPLSPGLNTKDTSNKYNRISTGGAASSIELEIPAEGRLYIYAACEKGVITLTQGTEEEENLVVSTLKSPKKIEKPATKFTKAYVKKGKATLKWTASTYICGIHFVPWEKITEE